MIARTIITKTKIHMRIKTHVATQPRTWIVYDSNAFPIANVAVTKAVFGKTNEYHVMAKVNFPLSMHDQCAPTEAMKNQMASLPKLSIHHVRSPGMLTPITKEPSSSQQL